MSHSAMSIAATASVKMPPGPAVPAAARSFRWIVSIASGSSPTTSAQSSSTAVRSAPEIAQPMNV